MRPVCSTLFFASTSRSILTGESKTIPIIQGKLGLGKYQGLYLYEHRDGTNTRKLIITLI
ncbi:MAG: YjbQ family protein [Candidatus Thioglobus sp.]